jgi:hypothetical protein
VIYLCSDSLCEFWHDRRSKLANFSATLVPTTDEAQADARQSTATSSLFPSGTAAMLYLGQQARPPRAKSHICTAERN